MRFSIGRVRTGAELEELIVEMMDDLDVCSDLHHAAVIREAHAAAEYRREHAYHFLHTVLRTDSGRTAFANNHEDVAKLNEERLIAAAEVAAAAELCRTRREQLGALRSLIASARAAEHG